MTIAISFMQHFAGLQVPRKNTHNKRHKMMDILILAILAIICGADTWVEVEEFGEAKEMTFIQAREKAFNAMVYLHHFKLKWKGFQSIAMVESTREMNGVKAREYRYYISSLPADAKKLAEAIRAAIGA